MRSETHRLTHGSGDEVVAWTLRWEVGGGRGRAIEPEESAIRL